MRPKTGLKIVAAAAVFFFGLEYLGDNQARATSYSKLIKKGYKVGKMQRGRSGKLGWYLTNGAEREFCNLNAVVVYVGKTGMAAFASSGRQIKMDRKAYESKTGGPNSKIPQLADLKAGRVHRRDVGRCTKVR